MAFDSSVSGRRRSRERNSLVGSSSGVGVKKKGGAFPSKEAAGKNPTMFPCWDRDMADGEPGGGSVEVIVLEESDSDSPPPPSGGGDDGVGTSERRSVSEGNDDTMMSIGSASDDDDDVGEDCDVDSTSKEFKTLSESDDEVDIEISSDEEFELCLNQSVDDSEEEEEWDLRLQRHHVKVDQRSAEQSGEQRKCDMLNKKQNHGSDERYNEEENSNEDGKKRKPGRPRKEICGDLSFSREVRPEAPHEVISIGSSDDDDDDVQHDHNSWVMSPGAVSSRTRSKVGGRVNQRGVKEPTLPRCGQRISPVRKKKPSTSSRGSGDKAKSSDGIIRGRKRGRPKRQKANEDFGFHRSDKSSKVDWNSRIDKFRKSGHGSSRKSDFFQHLADKIWAKDGDDEEVVGESQQVMHSLPVKFQWYDEKGHVEDEDSSDEMAYMWRMLELGLQGDEAGFYSHRNQEDVEDDQDLDMSQAALCCRGKHDLFVDEEIGQRCRYCSHIEVEIKYYCPPFEPPSPESRYRSFYHDQGNLSPLDGLQVQAPNSYASDCFGPNCNGTVWDLIPGVKDQMYKHQQEGFEFLWRNLAGSIVLEELKSNSTSDMQKDIGGCIISHAPGTGKTRLTLLFLQSYLELFPNSLPAIIVPASLLLTWVDEFKKWDIQIPLHNLNDELTGKEDTMALRMLDSHRLSHNINSVRMVKLYSWSKGKSIILISYNLFGELIREGLANQGMATIRKILLDLPGLVILDEGHAARNKNANLWNNLERIKTKKRVILSGTPFQNNLEELYNTIYIVRPKIKKLLPPLLKKFCPRGTVAQYDRGHNEAIIPDIKKIIAPFVHLHKGSILQKNLLGLKDCVVVLNPSELQLQVLRSFQGDGNDADVVMGCRAKNVFDFESKESRVSVHPSLALGFENLSSEQKTLISRKEEKLKACEFNPIEGVKTRFLVELIRFCISLGEKVLIFSQYVKSLKFISLQLTSFFGWTKGTDVLMMFGEQAMRQRQSAMKLFNDPSSNARVLLASINACSEGINLVGASRVVLLDVVWNPSVERQAICRAYRLGQKRVVYTYHLIVKGTTEWERYHCQVQKDRLSELVFSSATPCNGTAEKKPSVSSGDEILSEMTSHPKLRDMFDRILHQPKETDLVENFGHFV